MTAPDPGQAGAGEFIYTRDDVLGLLDSLSLRVLRQMRTTGADGRALLRRGLPVGAAGHEEATDGLTGGLNPGSTR